MWEVSVVAEVQAWFLELCVSDPETADQVEAAIELREQVGPALGRPVVDRLKGSRFHHMKELRPGSSGSSEVRLIFAFDPHRQAIILVAGDKSGQWRDWYRQAVPVAESRYEDHLTRLKEETDE